MLREFVADSERSRAELRLLSPVRQLLTSVPRMASPDGKASGGGHPFENATDFANARAAWKASVVDLQEERCVPIQRTQNAHQSDPIR